MGRTDHATPGYTRLTIIGWGYLIIFTLLLLAAWNTGTNLLYIVVGGLASFLVISFLFNFALLRKLSLYRTAPKAAYRDHPFQVHVQLENRRRFLPAISIRLENKRALNRSRAYIPYLPAGQAARLSVEECFEKRGEHTLDGYSIVCGFPFGLLERRRAFQDGTTILIYPRVHVVRASALQRIPSSGQMSTQSTGDGDEYFGLREYVPGDDIRRIVWRISARLGKWIVRELAQYQSRLVTISIDTTYNPAIDEFDEKFEQAVELAASLAIMLLRRRNEVAIATPTGYLEGGDGKGHERRVLEILARVVPTDGTEDFARQDNGQESNQTTLLLISPDPMAWGLTTKHGRVLDPREIVHG